MASRSRNVSRSLLKFGKFKIDSAIKNLRGNRESQNFKDIAICGNTMKNNVYTNIKYFSENFLSLTIKELNIVFIMPFD